MAWPAGRIMGRVRCRRLCNPLPGGAGHQPSGTTTGVRGASLDWDRQGRVTPVVTAQGLRSPVGASVKDRALLPSTQEAWPDPEPLGRESLWQEPRWNADRCAPPAYGGAAVRASHGRRALRLSAFRFRFFLSLSSLSFVMPGHSRSRNGVASLAYAGHPRLSVARKALPPALCQLRFSMDHRVFAR
jgi:hypothetical protein